MYCTTRFKTRFCFPPADARPNCQHLGGSQAGVRPSDIGTHSGEEHLMTPYPIGSMYGIYANIWGILMVNVTIYSIHGVYMHGVY